VRILVVCRFMTGFEQSVRSRVWNPSGAPAIRRLIEDFDRSDDRLDLIMTRLSAAPPLRGELQTLDGKVISLAGLRTPVRILFSGPTRLGRATVYLRDLLHTWKIWRRVRRTKPDIVYVDRSNVFTGAVLARMMRVPVVLRMLGVPPDLWTIIDGRHPAERLLRWAYRAPFAQVIGSMDGSGSEAWMRKTLDPSVPRQILLNGVDRDGGGGAPPAWLGDVVDGKTVVTLLGRVEALKGADFFIEAMLALPPASRDKIHALVVGEGALLDGLKQRVASAGANDLVTFTGALPHTEASGVLAASHIYVSLNRQGHLSNANLEAMAARLCFVVQRNSADGAGDPEFDQLLGPGSYVALSPDDAPEKLADVLTQLADDPERRERLAVALAHDVEEKLLSWDRRIQREIRLLQDVADRAA
jgi:glycosyltransferase involved in cell wall biosynthesis